MDGTLLVSKKTYSLSKKAPIVEWHTMPLSLDSIHSPKDAEMRVVDAALEGKSLDSEFRELEPSWSDLSKIKKQAGKLVPVQHGQTDVAWLIDKLSIAIIVVSHCKSSTRIVEAKNIDMLKERLA